MRILLIELGRAPATIGGEKVGDWRDVQLRVRPPEAVGGRSGLMCRGPGETPGH